MTTALPPSATHMDGLRDSCKRRHAGAAGMCFSTCLRMTAPPVAIPSQMATVLPPSATRMDALRDSCKRRHAGAAGNGFSTCLRMTAPPVAIPSQMATVLPPSATRMDALRDSCKRRHAKSACLRHPDQYSVRPGAHKRGIDSCQIENQHFSGLRPRQLQLRFFADRGSISGFQGNSIQHDSAAGHLHPRMSIGSQ